VIYYVLLSKGQTIIYKNYTETKDRAIQTPLKTGVNSSAQTVPSGKVDFGHIA